MEMLEMKSVYEQPRKSPPRMSFEEFLVWEGESAMTEWVDGEVVEMSPVSEKHQTILIFLLTLLNLHVEKNNLGRVLSEPFVMRLAHRPSGREPDLYFVSRERVHLIKRMYLDGPADLAVEIISPESVKRDRVEKFAEYETAGIREYWLIDPDRESAEFYELGADGRYRAARTQPEGLYHSQVVPGFFIRIAWLWQTPSPTFDALRELQLLNRR
jgi:Uma2 family endonuclease